MKIGVFIPIGNNGWLISSNAPQYMPSFELNKAIVQKAEHYQFDFALSMIKLRGFGGKTEFWDHNLESFTLMAALAAVTSRIKIYATAATLTLPPAIVARMASTIDSISNGRFGLNVVTGWQKPEYEQMGLWPGDEYFSRRYDYLSEYVEVLQDLWGTGQSDFKGEFFQMDDCRVSPQPQTPIKLICAAQSDAGMAFSAKYADYNFCFGKGVNTPTAFAPTAARLQKAAEQAGREVSSYVLFMIIADETDELARAKWESYQAGADTEALAWLTEQSGKDTQSGADTNVRQMADPTSAVNINMGTLVGSYANVAKMMDDIATVPGTEGILLTFDDFLSGIDNFGQHIQPLMNSRADIFDTLPPAAREVA
ncbi:TPA: pyrimidine utilization protein A [Yersinia enterocolitica]|uniref:pyrimidine utilization protein A n=1 Tax=Yersinia TaxID=629 RepID=UPI0005E307A4|nr:MULTISPECIES: pyrimidine utilization protein A [Yersinia]EKN3567211.1 pyrimidine utilization protein A [Yersinia enterocolitica]EKN3597882.1 pyrimidine utilization protein A [Yersinia enterocolitica]EKN3847993.1 pyrimidine utilization protein A [Yersinia enterocolitica]EKN4821426.1 pyrimidine utilization protein A [Yersinia enterocolitica]EKN4887274.1 pyrimidine utilization protein A [Yersinia enterocolitica]